MASMVNDSLTASAMLTGFCASTAAGLMSMTAIMAVPMSRIPGISITCTSR